MPQVLTLTRKPEESVEQFASRISAQMGKFFGAGTPAEQPDTAPAEEPAVENVNSPTDVSADEEPAPSA
jgi:hypothetical protein